MLQTQVELELDAYTFGKDRMRKSIETNEQKDRAHSNPYAQAIYRRFVLPLASRISEDLRTASAVPGRRKAHVALLSPMDLEAVAFVSVRAALTSLLSANSSTNGREIVKAVGRDVYHEYLLSQFADAEPTLFYHLMNDLDRRLSSNERHRMTVLKMQARKNGLEFNEWGSGDRDQVGAYLVDVLEQLGMVTVSLAQLAGEKFKEHVVALSQECSALVKEITEFVVESAPFFQPCVEPPKDWVSITDGGFHTAEMRRLSPFMVKTHPYARDTFALANMQREIDCVNALQQVKWRVNRTMLDHISNIARHFDVEEIIAQAETPKPRKPEWLTPGMKKEDMNPSQEREFKKWKREVAEWHTDEKVRSTKSNRFYNAMRTARKFVDYPSIYFVYFLDFRSRKYAQTTGINPQGSDLQKALIEFSEGKPLLTQDAKDWFCITGANRWGFDKATLPQRVQWVRDHHEQIMAFATDPVDNPDWQQADKPLQFLAWCCEYMRWQSFGDRFLSRVAVGMDGSCNGLQNFSAMLRDSHGGRATNLVPAELPNDIYQMVADLTTRILEEEEDDPAGFRKLWLDHGLTRNLVKRSVMTLPYGSRRMSCRDFIIKDYLIEGKFPGLDKKKYRAAAEYLSYRVWAAIAQVVVKAREAMDWLQKGSAVIMREGHETIRWVTPTGFPVTQVYWEQTIHRINSKLCGNAKFRLHKDGETPDRSKHRNGIAPNLIHSLDAAHLTLVVNAAKARGIHALAMIHDDYGTHAADAQALYAIIREEFVGMYERHDVLDEWHTAYPSLPPPPAMGDLDLRAVLDSPFFFS